MLNSLHCSRRCIAWLYGALQCQRSRSDVTKVTWLPVLSGGRRVGVGDSRLSMGRHRGQRSTGQLDIDGLRCGSPVQTEHVAVSRVRACHRACGDVRDYCVWRWEEGEDCFCVWLRVCHRASVHLQIPPHWRTRHLLLASLWRYFYRQQCACANTCTDIVFTQIKRNNVNNRFNLYH